MNRLLIKAVMLMGLLCLIASARDSWFELPVGISHAEGTVAATTVQPWATPWYQAGSLAVVIVISVFWLFRPGTRYTDISLLSLWMVLLLMYPWCVMIRDPEISARASWLQTQHENLTWLGGDLSISEEYKNANWKSRLYVVDAPRRVTSVQLPMWGPSQFGLDQLPDLLEWTGVTNTFCQFVHRGWLIAVFGSACLLMAACFADGQIQVPRLRHSVLAIVLAATVICMLEWSFPFRAGRHLSAAHVLTARGQYAAALDRIEQAARILPVLREDTCYIAQVGLLEHRLQRRTAAAVLFTANLLEREGLSEQALQQYEELALDDELPASLRREACRGLLRSAVNSLNSGSIASAIVQLRRVITVEPCNLKANYALQLACLHSGRRHELDQLVDHIYVTYSYFRFPNKKVVLAASQQNAFFAAVQNGDLDEAWDRSVRMKSP